MKYKSLIELSLDNTNDIDNIYRSRIENSCAYKSKLKINPIIKGKKEFSISYNLFYLSINEILLLQDKIYSNSKIIMSLNSLLSDEDRKNCIDYIIKNAINNYNEIENKYKQIVTDNIKKIKSYKEIEELYNEIFKDNMLQYKKNNFKNINDEELYIINLINFMEQQDIDSLIKASIAYYYFEYIYSYNYECHIIGKLLLSSYLAKKIDLYTGLSISNSIYLNKNKYYNLFTDVSNKRNYGEITFFIIGMLELIIKGQKNIIEILKK